MPGSRTGARSGLAIAGVLCLAVVLRLLGIGYGLPAVYNPDEVAIMSRALGLSQTHLNPHNFLYPTLYFYALFAWEGAWFVVGRLTGIYASLQAFEASFFVDPSSIYLAGRLLSAVCGVATVWATYRLAAVLFGRFAGFSAGLIAAVAPLAVRDAHYVKHDVAATLLIVLTHVVLASDLVAADGRRRTVLGAALAGLAMSTHYYAVFLALPVAMIALHPTPSTEPFAPRLRRLLVAGAVCTFAFLAASPFLLVEPMTALRDVTANREIVMDRATTATGTFGSLGFYLDWLLRDAAGRPAFVLAVAGVVAGALFDWRRAGFLLVFPAVFLLFIANTFPASRYLNPIVPFVAVFAGAALGWLHGRSRAATLATALLLAVTASEGALMSLRADAFFNQADTRTQAQAWIERHVANGASVLVQPYSVPLRMSKAALTEALTAHLGSADRASVKFQRQLALDPYPAPAYRTIYLGEGGLDTDKLYVSPGAFAADIGLSPLTRLNVTWVVMKRYNVDDPAMATVTKALERGGRLAASFSPYAASADAATRRQVAPFLHNTDARIRPELARPGPIIEVWTID